MTARALSWSIDVALALLISGLAAVVWSAELPTPPEPDAARPGAVCTYLSAEPWATPSLRVPRLVRIVELAPLPTGTPGAWVEYLAVPLAGGQVPKAALIGCRAT